MHVGAFAHVDGIAKIEPHLFRAGYPVELRVALPR